MHLVWAEYGNLISRKVSERSVAHRLAVYLEREYDGLHVDCEYNRSHNKPKSVMVFRENLPPKKLKELVERIKEAEHIDDQTAEAVMHFRISPYPDIVVHRRNHNSYNTLIVEVKYLNDERGDEGREYDRAKLKAFTDPSQGYKYKVGVFLEIDPKFANIEVYTKQGLVLQHTFNRKDSDFSGETISISTP